MMIDAAPLLLWDWYCILVVRRQVCGSPRSSGRIRGRTSGVTAAARRRDSTSAKISGSSKCDSPASVNWLRMRPRTRRCTSSITSSTSTAGALSFKSLARARPHLHRGDGAADLTCLLLQPERDAVCTGLAVHMVRGEAALNLALARFIRIAVAGVFGNG